MRRVLSAVVGLLCMAAAPALAQAPPSGTVRYYHTDALGSVRAVTDAAGNVVARHDYFPFGDEPASAPDRAAQRFTGAERDPESSMDYFQARYYMQRLGRFTSSDPEHIGGNPADPQSWNAYAYARNNPLRFVDMFGTDYVIALDGIAPYRIGETDFLLLQMNPGNGFRLFAGDIQQMRDGKWTTIGAYYDSLVVLSSDIATTTAPVAKAVGVATVATRVALGFAFPIQSMLADCLTTPSSCRSRDGVSLAMPLPRAARRILGGLLALENMTVTEAILARGGGGGQVQKVATWLRSMKVGQTAIKAAEGNEEALTAIKIIKGAKRLAEKGGG